MLTRTLVILIGTALLATGCAQTQPPEDAAKDVFERYVALEADYNPRMTRLYADDAVIRVRPHQPRPASWTELPIDVWRTTLKERLTVAKRKKDRISYTQPEYRIEGEQVRISSFRHVMDRYLSDGVSAPHELVVMKVARGRWLIVREDRFIEP